MTDCVVVGGGIAGLVAAAELCSNGYSVILLERKPMLGGRTFSFNDPLSGDVLDNGQHLLMGCYSATLRFLEMIGAKAGVDRIEKLRLPFHNRDGRTGRLELGWLPHPFGLMQAFLQYELLTWHDRLNIITAAWRLKKLNLTALNSLDACAVSEWLNEHQQSERAIEFFWRPLILATMNADLHEASAKLFAIVFREVFLGLQEHSSLILPNTGLSDVFVTKAVEYIEKFHGRIHLRTTVLRVSNKNNHIVIATNNGTLNTRSVITALPPWHLESLLGKETNVQFDRFIPSPILSIHLWSKTRITDERMTGLFGTHTQWIFSKGKAQDNSWLYSCTISAARRIVDMRPREIEELVIAEICDHFPNVYPSHIMRTKVIKERAATFIPRPGLEQYRPKPTTTMHGVFIAGDWTATSLPATIESSSRSGFAAAREAKEFLEKERNEI